MTGRSSSEQKPWGKLSLSCDHGVQRSVTPGGGEKKLKQFVLGVCSDVISPFPADGPVTVPCLINDCSVVRLL